MAPKQIDPYKIMYGQLLPNVTKTAFLKFLSANGVPTPAETYINRKEGAPTCIFALFYSIEDAEKGKAVAGIADYSVTHTQVKACNGPRHGNLNESCLICKIEKHIFEKNTQTKNPVQSTFIRVAFADICRMRGARIHPGYVLMSNDL